MPQRDRALSQSRSSENEKIKELTIINKKLEEEVVSLREAFA